VVLIATPPEVTRNWADADKVVPNAASHAFLNPRRDFVLGPRLQNQAGCVMIPPVNVQARLAAVGFPRL